MTISGSEALDFEQAETKAYELMEKGDKFGFLILCGINFGLRITDLLGVTYDQIKSGQFIVGEKKTGKKRIICVNKAVEKGLNYMAELDPVRYELGGQAFVSQKGTVYSSQHVNRKLKKIFGEGYSSHGMRKAFGKRLYEVSGKDLSVVQLQLQHGNPEDTLRYIGVTQERMNQCFHML